MSKKVQIGVCGVDAGMIMVGDPCYFVGRDSAINDHCENWDQACNEVFCKPETKDRDHPMDIYGLGVAVATTNGDGCFPVTLETLKNGRRRLIVDLG